MLRFDRFIAMTRRDGIAIIKRRCTILPPMQPICTHTICVQSAKASHAYPIILLPRAFRELAGSKAAIYQTVHEGKLAFLVKILDHTQEELSTGSNSDKEPSHGGGRRFESGWAHRSFTIRYAGVLSVLEL